MGGNCLLSLYLLNVTQKGNEFFYIFRKLGRLALGLKRSDIDKLSIDSFTDFVAEFSQISNWTLSQVCIYCRSNSLHTNIQYNE
jgi:hypothetical protein